MNYYNVVFLAKSKLNSHNNLSYDCLPSRPLNFPKESEVSNPNQKISLFFCDS